MQVMTNPGDGVHVSGALEAHVQRKLRGVDRRFGERLTRVEVHFKDSNGGKGGVDTSCVMESHPAGLEPVVVEADAEDAYTASHAAAKKLEKALDHRVGRAEARNPKS